MDYEQFLEGFHASLKDIEGGYEPAGQKWKRGTMACRNALTTLKEELQNSKFTDKAEEIYFFKEIKGCVLTHLIYYLELQLLEEDYPIISTECQKAYLLRKQQKIRKFFKRNKALVKYVKDQQTFLDEYYFTIDPGKETWQLCQSGFYTDPAFYTTYDLKISKIKAYKKLLFHIKVRYLKLENPAQYAKSSNELAEFQWTGSKVALTELLYALYSSKVINNGKADIKHIAGIFQKIFNIEIGDYYKIYSEIKTRQKSKTKFLEELTINLSEMVEGRGI